MSLFNRLAPASLLAVVVAFGLVAACGGPSAGAGDSGADAGLADATVGDVVSDTVTSDGHPPFPQVPNTSGKTLVSPSLVTIVASNDTPSDGTDTVANLNAFSDVIPGSAVWAATSSEYHIGPLSSVVHISGPAITAGGYTNQQIADLVTAAIANDAGPSPNGNTIYLLYLPTGATFSGVDAPDCGYHEPYPLTTSTGDQVAAVQRCPPYAEESQLGVLTRTATHEIVESATDPLDKGYNLGLATAQPWNGSAWLALEGNSHIEVGDLCIGSRIFEALDGGPDGGWDFQRIWSNAAAATGGDPCVPPRSEPYYTASVPTAWYPVAAGGTVTIPFTAWSTSGAAQWIARPSVGNASPSLAHVADDDAGIVVSTPLGVGTGSGCVPHEALNNDVSGTMTLVIPATAKSGDFAVLWLESRRPDLTAPLPARCYAAADEDFFHFWPVGIYLP